MDVIALARGVPARVLVILLAVAVASAVVYAAAHGVLVHHLLGMSLNHKTGMSYG